MPFYRLIGLSANSNTALVTYPNPLEGKQLRYG